MCVYETGSPLLFAYISHLLILPLSFFLGVGVPSLSFAGFMLKAVRRGSFVILMVRCCFGGLCARDGLATCLVFAGVALLLLPLSLFLGVRAPSLSLGRFMNSKLLDVAHCSFSHQLFLLCFGFIGATSWPPQNTIFFASICHANTDPPVTKIRLWASFGV